MSMNIILAERKFKEDIIKLVNESNLPAFILKNSVKEIYEQLVQAEQAQYENALKEQEKEETKKKEKK